MVVGDTHGGKSNILPKIKMAGESGIDRIIVCGDAGLWTHFFDGHVFLDAIQRTAEDNNVSVFFIGGNHENWDHWEWFVANMPKAKGWAYVRSRVLLAPKVHKWTWAGKQFVSAGGAVSIDKSDRLHREAGYAYDEFKGRYVQKTPAPRTLYWDNEQLTDQDVIKIQEFGVDADYLFTHDCSNKTPFRGRLKPDLDSQIHRKRIDKVLLHTSPEIHFHGHMHTKYDWMNFVGETNGEAVYVQTYGLECNSDYNSWGTLDVETGRFVWHDTQFKVPPKSEPILDDSELNEYEVED